MRLGPSRNGNEEVSTCTKTGTSTQYSRKQVESEFHTYLCREEKLSFEALKNRVSFSFLSRKKRWVEQAARAVCFLCYAQCGKEN